MSLSRTCPCTGSCGLFYKDRGLASTRTTASCAGSNLSRSRLNMDSSGYSWHSRWSRTRIRVSGCCSGRNLVQEGSGRLRGLLSVQDTSTSAPYRPLYRTETCPDVLSRGLVQDRAPPLVSSRTGPERVPGTVKLYPGQDCSPTLYGTVWRSTGLTYVCLCAGYSLILEGEEELVTHGHKINR